jgi:hypothetical protein
MAHENAGDLRQQLLSAGTPLKDVFTVVLLSRRYNTSRNHPGLFLELLDYRLERRTQKHKSVRRCDAITK